MDDVYAINVAKTEFREAYNTGDIERLLAIVAKDLIDYSDGRRSGFGDGAREALRARLEELFASYDVRLAPIVIEIKVMGEVAVDYGWHELTLTPGAAANRTQPEPATSTYGRETEQATGNSQCLWITPTCLTPLMMLCRSGEA